MPLKTSLVNLLIIKQIYLSNSIFPNLTLIGFLLKYIYSCAPVAQLDRVPGYEPGGRGFESYPAHQDFCDREPSGSFFFVFR